MRFLYSTWERFPTFRVDLTILFSAGLAGKGHRIDWHMQSAQPSATRVEHIGRNERVYVGRASRRAALVGRVLNQFYGLWHDMRILRIVAVNDYDFVQVRDKAFASLVGLIAAKRKGIPFYYWMSFPYPEADIFFSEDPQMELSRIKRIFYRIRGRLKAWMLYKIVLPRADHVFVQSDRMKADVAQHGISLERMTPVPMGIDPAAVAAAVSSSDPLDSRLDGMSPLVYIGTLDRARRVDLLLDMLVSVREHEPAAVLVLVGDASERDMDFLHRKARDLGIENSVLFTGFIPMDQAWRYVHAARVALSPFRPSPIFDVASPTKLVEYLTLGCPVVANSHPDQTKILEESGAGHPVDFDSAAFAGEVVRLLRDPEGARVMAQKGADYVKRHRSYEVLSANLEAKYLELLGRDAKGQAAEVTP